MRTSIVAAFVAALAFAPGASAQLIVGPKLECEVSALPQNSSLDNLRKLTDGDEPFQIQICQRGKAGSKTYRLFTRPEALIEGVCRFRSVAIYQQGVHDGYLEWSNIPPPASSSSDAPRVLMVAPGHEPSYFALSKGPCPPPSDNSYIGTRDISAKKFAEIIRLWRAVTASEASFVRFFGGEDAVSKDRLLTSVRDHLFLSTHDQDQVTYWIDREKLSLIDWVIPSYGISIGFDDDTSYDIVVRDGIGGLSFRSIGENIY